MLAPTPSSSRSSTSRALRIKDLQAPAEPDREDIDSEATATPELEDKEFEAAAKPELDDKGPEAAAKPELEDEGPEAAATLMIFWDEADVTCSYNWPSYSYKWWTRLINQQTKRFWSYNCGGVINNL